jgi:hypothetical protein
MQRKGRLSELLPVGLTLEERFWAKVDISGPDECWLWTAHRNKKGYGTFKIGDKSYHAHRVSFMLEHNMMPPLIDHACRNKGCVNPTHLRAVTNKQNLENLGIHSKNTSGVRGVNWNPKSRKWSARVKHNRKQYWGGSFDRIEDAEAAVIALRNSLFTHNDADRKAS